MTASAPPVLSMRSGRSAGSPMVPPVTQPMRCVVCQHEMAAHLEADLWRCACCKYQCSTFVDDEAHGDEKARPATPLNEAHRRLALESLRRSNAQTILGVLGRFRSLRGASLCDIGCGYGWFLEQAEVLGIAALGIEPDAPVAAQASERGLNVRCGNFPDCLGPDCLGPDWLGPDWLGPHWLGPHWLGSGEQFDLLALNDVLEHLPQIERMVAACRDHLAPGGLLAIALPTSGGTMFRIGSMLRRFGIRGPLDRLWQRDYPSPHRHYFNADNLERLLARFGLKPVHSQALPGWQLSGLWSRLRMDESQPIWKAALAWIALTLAYPLLRCLPSDILLQVYRAVDDQPA